MQTYLRILPVLHDVAHRSRHTQIMAALAATPGYRHYTRTPAIVKGRLQDYLSPLLVSFVS